MTERIVKIGTRESRLAVVQAELVAEAIRRSEPDFAVELVTMKTTGDKILDRTLDKVGGKGLFVKELDEALRRGDVDICAHSCKDLPSELDEALPVVALGAREDPRDVLILPEGRTEPEPGKPIGCASQRRAVQLRELYPDLQTAPVRGNVLTRLEKLDRGEYSALTLAAAGIVRLGLERRISRVFSPDELLPAACQGIIAVQGRREQDYRYLAAFHSRDSHDAATAERAFTRRLNCGCGAPVAAYAETSGTELRLRAMIADEAGGLYRGSVHGSREQAEELGLRLAEELIRKAEQG